MPRPLLNENCFLIGEKGTESSDDGKAKEKVKEDVKDNEKKDENDKAKEEESKKPVVDDGKEKVKDGNKTTATNSTQGKSSSFSSHIVILDATRRFCNGNYIVRSFLGLRQ